MYYDSVKIYDKPHTRSELRNYASSYVAKHKLGQWVSHFEYLQDNKEENLWIR